MSLAKRDYRQFTVRPKYTTWLVTPHWNAPEDLHMMTTQKTFN